MPYDVHLCAYVELLRIVIHDDVWSGSRPVGNVGIKGTVNDPCNSCLRSPGLIKGPFILGCQFLYDHDVI